MNELITTKGVEVNWVNDNDNGKTVMHKACELVKNFESLDNNKDTGICGRSVFLIRKTTKRLFGFTEGPFAVASNRLCYKEQSHKDCRTSERPK